jgi:hypothetical protein
VREAVGQGEKWVGIRVENGWGNRKKWYGKRKQKKRKTKNRKINGKNKRKYRER